MQSSRTRRPAVPTWVTSLGLVVLATVLLVRDLGRPEGIVFDEVYYVGDARDYLQFGTEGSFAVHPPLGKWLLAAGIRFVGDDPFGWRIPAAVAGVLLVLVVHGLAHQLLSGARHRESLAAAAALLLLLDGVFLVQARTAMLDVFLALFTAVGVWLLVVDRDLALSGDRWPVRHGRGLRLLAGVAFGCALAVKWSGLLGLGVGGLLALTWELSLRHRATGRWWTGLPRLVAGVGLSLVVVPAVVYAASWVPWGASFQHTSTAGCREAGDPPATCEVTTRERVAGVLEHQRDMWDFHTGLEATHPYRSAPLGWPVLARPVVYSYETCSPERAAGTPTEDLDTGELVDPEPCMVAPGEAAEVILLGNLVTWWGFLLAVPLLVAGAARRDRRSLVPLLGWAGQLLPWLVVSRPSFLFYMVPAVPFQALGIAVALAALERRRAARWPLALGLVGAGIGAAVGAAGAAAVAATTTTPVVLVGAAGWALGAALGGLVTERGRSRSAEPPPGGDDDRGRRSTVPAAVGVTVLAAAALFVFFAPVWTGQPLPEAEVRQRWWFDSWV